ncbi:MAG: hypothetical protein HQL75_14370 [Magnetococcales bacterium]|nr:hypothetical protein [Magnetococcales bacterium]
MKKILFNDALRNAIDFVSTQRDLLSRNPVLVRDLRGRIRVALDASNEKDDPLFFKIPANISNELYKILGNFSYSKKHIFLFREDLPDLEHFFQLPELRPLKWEGDKPILHLLERQVTGQDWLHLPPLRDRDVVARPHRFAVFGLKGGVGRSTALAIWAWHLAQQGRKVLVIDLDLESPGIGSTLLRNGDFPAYGVIDWFVESAVGQEKDVLQDMVSKSSLHQRGEGSIRVVPCYGFEEPDYMAKLARCYQGIPGKNGPISWVNRLETMVHELEQKEQPDVVLLDSRAGLHDIAAATLLHLNATVFLFAVDTPQTWSGYHHLFMNWARLPQFSQVRHRFQIVAAMIPERNPLNYLRSFNENSYSLFSSTLYYEESVVPNAEVFNFDLNDKAAPHASWNIRWRSDLEYFNPANDPEEIPKQTMDAAMGEFLEKVDRLLEQRSSS